jgi:PAS domain S-box-containing protein
MVRRNLSALLAEYTKPVRALAAMPKFSFYLDGTEPSSLDQLNVLLDHFNITLEADVCYLMDADGNTVASSNRMSADSFVGKNFSFRPYFIEAMQGRSSTYMALGTTSGKRGVYHSYLVYGSANDPVGVVVIKASIQLIEKELGLTEDEIVLVIDPQGVIFISNREEWLYNLIWQADEDVIRKIERSRQFGDGPWRWSGLVAEDDNHVRDDSGNRYLMHRANLEQYPGWQLIHLRSMDDIARIASTPFIRTVRPVIFILCLLVGLSVFFLYRRASREILKRKAVENALRESETRYRSLYHNTPAMLHSIDRQGCLLSVSNHWCEALGYDREEVIGRPITDFFTDASRLFAETTILPRFFKDGFCQDVAYQFVKKSGEVIDILLSAYGDRNRQGEIIRSLAVSIDVTERNRALAALQDAKEELSRYSKDLERQVNKRTREITNILRYTPDVVYVKDNQGRYVLVNSRFEELFGVTIDEVKGKTDYEIPAIHLVADQFHCHDQQVLQESEPCQVEERIPQQDGDHIYLSVKFPIYDESGIASGVCGISTDITAVKKAQDQLRRLSGSILAGQEKERSAIARELHDELGQMLTAMRMDSVWLADHLKDSEPKAAERAEALCRLIDTTIMDVRGIAIRLRPGVLDDLGLVDALEWFTGDYEKRSDIICVFEAGKVPELPDSVATAAYRITQEALTNVARHSGATRVEVKIDTVDGVLSLTVEDNGCGINEGELPDEERFGIAGMKERATLAGGSLLLEPQPDGGTRVCFKVRLDIIEKETV